jgi:protein phosphatase 1L
MGIAGKDGWLLMASDGLFANEERGGGGGLSNQEVASYVTQNAGSGPIDGVVDGLISEAQKAGSTDDITTILLRLSN